MTNKTLILSNYEASSLQNLKPLNKSHQQWALI